MVTLMEPQRQVPVMPWANSVGSWDFGSPVRGRAIFFWWLGLGEGEGEKGFKGSHLEMGWEENEGSYSRSNLEVN